MTHSLITSTWVYGFYNTEKFVTFDEVIAQEQVYVMNLWRIMNSNITVLNIPTKSKIKTHITLSMTCYI